ncbi:O-antigen ligase family protein [Nitrospirillum sp. BR 11828]|uniref:O-antigen ligase family protein n=1 Tax=Nitrospirillum sp. BR 11828 TaxID=3104325 RepID=UPI002ACAEAD0|nr:O-antigen ligase family protein [Nitrospirillum sp. BR 11828]MDZ5649113.1 O-antigen ligase family protein [Nitrospirillum sp. BR 11828]
MSLTQTTPDLRTTAPVLPPPHPIGHTLSTTKALPFSLPWMGLTLFLVTILGFICALLPLGTAPTLISLSVLGGILYALRARRLPAFLTARATWRASPMLPLVLCLALGAVSVLWTPVRKDGISQLLTFLYTVVPFLFWMGTLREVDERRRWLLLRWATLGMVVGLAIFAIEVLGDQPIYRLEKALEGTKVDHDRALNRPAVLFATLAWPLGLALARLAWVTGRGAFARLPALAAMVPPPAGRAMPWAWVMPAAFFLTALGGTSASAKVGLGTGLVFYGLARLSARTARAVMIALLLAGPILSIPISLGLHRAGLTEETRMPWSFRHRVEIWDVAARRILEKPVFGWGLDSSRNIPDEGEVSKFHPESPIIPLHPHNIFLQVLLELGVVGSVLHTWLGAGLALATRRLPAYAQATALAAIAATIAVGCFSYGAWQTWWLCGIMLAAGLLELNLPAGWWARGPGAAKARAVKARQKR